MWKREEKRKKIDNNKKNNYKRWKEYLKKIQQEDESKEVTAREKSLLFNIIIFCLSKSTIAVVSLALNVSCLYFGCE